MTRQTKVYYYQFFCPNGATLSLMPEPNGRYKVMYGEENLGSYHTAKAAAEDVAGGHTFFPSDGTDPSTLGIPEELGEWTVKDYAKISGFRPT